MNTKNKKSYFLLIVFLILGVCFLFIIVPSILKINKSIRNNLSNVNKTQIKNNFLKDDPKATINYIFINTLPDETKTIYICGTNIKVVGGSIGALVYSNNDGKTWENDTYFNNIQGQPTPIINKMVTEYYNDNEAVSDSLVVIGKYLPSIPSTDNESLNYAGQIEYQTIYYALPRTIINIVTHIQWTDYAWRDAHFDSDTKKVKNAKVVAASPVRLFKTLPHTKKNVLQCHIYFVTNDESVDVNGIQSASHRYVKFRIYDLVVHFNGNSPSFSSTPLSHLSPAINTSDMYGKVVDGKLISKTLFDPDKSRFVFESGQLDGHGTSVSLYKSTILVVIKHFDEDNTDKNNIKPSYDNSSVFSFDYDYYLENFYNLESGTVFDNFKINSVAVNPYAHDATNTSNSSNPLIFGGQKNNSAYIVSPKLIMKNVGTESLNSTKFTSKIITNSSGGSYITNIIPFANSHDKIDSKKETTPLIIVGNNINTKDLNFGSLNNAAKLTPNTQNIQNSSLLLANIKYNSNTQESNIIYSQKQNFENEKNTSFVDDSDNYSTVLTPSINEPNYSYNFYCITNSSLYFSSSVYVRISIDKIGDNFEFFSGSKVIKKKKESIAVIIAPIIAVIIFLMLMICLILLLVRKKVFGKFGKYKGKLKLWKIGDKAIKMLENKTKLLNVFKNKKERLKLTRKKKK